MHLDIFQVPGPTGNEHAPHPYRDPSPRAPEGAPAHAVRLDASIVTAELFVGAWSALRVGVGLVRQELGGEEVVAASLLAFCMFEIVRILRRTRRKDEGDEVPTRLG